MLTLSASSPRCTPHISPPGSFLLGTQLPFELYFFPLCWEEKACRHSSCLLARTAQSLWEASAHSTQALLGTGTARELQKVTPGDRFLALQNSLHLSWLFALSIESPGGNETLCGWGVMGLLEGAHQKNTNLSSLA